MLSLSQCNWVIATSCVWAHTVSVCLTTRVPRVCVCVCRPTAPHPVVRAWLSVFVVCDVCVFQKSPRAQLRCATGGSLTGVVVCCSTRDIISILGSVQVLPHIAALCHCIYRRNSSCHPPRCIIPAGCMWVFRAQLGRLSSPGTSSSVAAP